MESYYTFSSHHVEKGECMKVNRMMSIQRRRQVRPDRIEHFVEPTEKKYAVRLSCALGNSIKK